MLSFHVGDPNSQGFCDSSPSGRAQRKQNISDRFCPIVKRVDCTGLDMDICCKPEHQDLIIFIGMWWHSTKGLDASNLFSVLGRVETFWSGSDNLSHKERDRDKGKGQIC